MIKHVVLTGVAVVMSLLVAGALVQTVGWPPVAVLGALGLLAAWRLAAASARLDQLCAKAALTGETRPGTDEEFGQWASQPRAGRPDHATAAPGRPPCLVAGIEAGRLEQGGVAHGDPR